MPSAILVLLPIIVLTLAGDYFLKVAAEGRGFRGAAFYLGTAFYAISACGILIAMRHMTLASVGVWYSVLTILAMTALGTLVFDESLSRREVLGIVLAFAALACMSRFA